MPHRIDELQRAGALPAVLLDGKRRYRLEDLRTFAALLPIAPLDDGPQQQPQEVKEIDRRPTVK